MIRESKLKKSHQLIQNSSILPLFLTAGTPNHCPELTISLSLPPCGEKGRVTEVNVTRKCGLEGKVKPPVSKARY